MICPNIKNVDVYNVLLLDVSFLDNKSLMNYAWYTRVIQKDVYEFDVHTHTRVCVVLLLGVSECEAEVWVRNVCVRTHTGSSSHPFHRHVVECVWSVECASYTVRLLSTSS